MIFLPYILSMETIFAHNPTKEELEALCGSVESAKHDVELCEQHDSADSAFALIAGLMDLRGDHQAVDTYLAKIKDARYREETRQGLNGCILA